MLRASAAIAHAKCRLRQSPAPPRGGELAPPACAISAATVNTSAANRGAGMPQAMDAQRFGNGDGDEKVRHGEQPGFLGCAPALLFGGSALGAAAVVAAVE